MTRISDMAVLPALPASAGFVPLVKTGIQVNYAYDLAADLAGRPTSAGLAASSGSSLLGFIQSGTGAVSRTLQARLRDVVSVKDFGAVGDGVTDDRAAIAAAVAASQGKRIIFPKGNYLINTDGGTITLEEVGLTGENVLDGATGSIDEGVNLWIIGTTNGAFKVRRGVSVEGLGIYYPNQTDTSSPTVYPTTFTFDFTNGAVQFVQFLRNVVYNAYKLIDIDNGSTGGVGHVEIVGNYICALNRGIYLRYNLEHFRVERNNFTFGHWLAATEAGARAYMRLNATAFEVAQSDGVEFVDNMIFGYLNGVLAGGTSLCQFMKISDNKIDQVRYGIKITGSGNFTGQILANTFNSINGQNTALQGRSIHIDTSGAAVEHILISVNNFAQAAEEHIYTSGTAQRNLSIGSNAFEGWAKDKTSAFGALNINGANTNVTMTGGRVYGGSNATWSNGIVGSFNALNLSGATFDQCLTPISATVTYYLGAGNQSFNTGGSTSDSLTATNNFDGNRWDKPQGETTKPQVLARKGSAQTFNSGTMTDCSWDTETYDKGSNFATPSFTAPYKGRYRFEWTLTHDNTGTAGDRWLIQIITSAGALLTHSYKMIADYNTVKGGGELQLGAAGVTAKLQIQRVGGAGNFVTTADANANYFSISPVD